MSQNPLLILHQYEKWQNYLLSTMQYQVDSAVGTSFVEACALCAQVFPDSADLAPYGSCTFHVGFRPPRDGVYYCQRLLVCAHIKAMRNFRLVEDDQVTPPWNAPLLVSRKIMGTRQSVCHHVLPSSCLRCSYVLHFSCYFNKFC